MNKTKHTSQPSALCCSVVVHSNQLSDLQGNGNETKIRANKSLAKLL